eukprot:TRINITY_DN94555_c0_g1_i1.p1 TRINITY_DN94555_c0_g1~~TRINITY_DN94555_c0_g1_i1.p1  ORF type:complete len:560 (+),score=96.26 TRINITY_DN94555_c0_g1_i1:40-1719(+)
MTTLASRSRHRCLSAAAATSVALLRGMSFAVGSANVASASSIANAASIFAEEWKGPAVEDSVRIRAVSWNVAAVNNNPFEYWITHPNPAYKTLMEDIEKFITNPGKDDIQIYELFTDEMFQRLMTRMKEAGIQHLDTVTQQWDHEYRGRRIVSGFLTDSAIGKKRLASMPDRVTNTIQLASGEVAYRPTVINCYGEDISSMEKWFDRWLEFFFDTKVDVDGKGPKPVYSLLQKIKKSKYPAVTVEEEEASIPLQLVLQGVFDAILVNVMQSKGGDSWQGLRKHICESLNRLKNTRINEILHTTYKDADVVFLQEAGNSLIDLLRKAYGGSHDIIIPKSFSSKRAQNSIILLRKDQFQETIEIEIEEPLWDSGDLLMIKTRAMTPSSRKPWIVMASFHGDTQGLLTSPTLDKVMEKLKVERDFDGFLFGLDANTHHVNNEKIDKAMVPDFVKHYKGLGLESTWGDDALTGKLFTTFNARTYLQPQLNKAAKSSELAEKGDHNLKDYILFSKDRFVLGGAFKDNTGSSEYLEDIVFPTLEFPSDHAAISADLLLKSAKSEL